MKTPAVRTAIVSGMIAAGVIVAAQQGPPDGPAFEVASVKPNKSGDARMMIGMQPGGRITMTNVPVRQLIRLAFRLQESQIVGGPPWMGSDRFDIVAKAEGNPGPDQQMLMVKSLLAERFRLQTHEESREQPIFALMLARTDRQLGPKLTPAAIDCQAGRGRGRMAGPPPNGPPGRPPSGAGGDRMQCGIQIGPGRFSAGGMPISQMATSLGPLVNRYVIDRTGLTGPYDIELEYTPEFRGDTGGAPSADRPPVDGTSIFTAIQEQLGLKLDAQRAPVPVLVIDRLEMPVPD